MNPGRLRQQVTLQTHAAASADALGGRADAWDDVATVWAAIEPLDGTEALRAMQQGIRQPHRITMRYRAGVTAAQRILYGARTFNLRSVVDVEMRHRELSILADEVTP